MRCSYSKAILGWDGGVIRTLGDKAGGNCFKRKWKQNNSLGLVERRKGVPRAWT